MAFSWRPRRAPTAVPPIRVPVFAVGPDAYVACAGDRTAGATLAQLYRTLHDALGFRIESTDIAIGKLRR